MNSLRRMPRTHTFSPTPLTATLEHIGGQVGIPLGGPGRAFSTATSSATLHAAHLFSIQPFQRPNLVSRTETQRQHCRAREGAMLPGIGSLLRSEIFVRRKIVAAMLVDLRDGGNIETVAWVGGHAGREAQFTTGK